MRTILSIVVFFFLVAPLYGQVAAAGWCVVANNNQSDSQPPDDPLLAPDPNDQSSDESLGCDMGVGFSLYTYHDRLAWVAVLGSESLGSGVAWIINPQAKSAADHRPIIAIAIGIVTPYDTQGISNNIQFALGATLSLRGVKEDE
jgi:hypothetical protein